MPGVKGQKRREYAPLELGDLKVGGLVKDPNEIQKLTPKRGVPLAERTPVMLQFDKWAAELYAAWEKAGKPSEFAKSPIRKQHVSPEQVDTVKFLAGKSAQFLGHSANFGAQGVKDADGRVVVSWRVVDPRPRNKSGENGSQK